MMKRCFGLLTVLLLLPGAAFACDVCNPDQAEFLRNLTHGTSPEGSVDWIIAGFTALLVLFTLVGSIKFLVRPGESNHDHIKRTVLDFEYREHQS